MTATLGVVQGEATQHVNPQREDAGRQGQAAQFSVAPHCRLAEEDTAA